MRKALITRKAIAPAVKAYAASADSCNKSPKEQLDSDCYVIQSQQI